MNEWKEYLFEELIQSMQLGTSEIGSENNFGVPLLKMGNLLIGGFNFIKLEKLKENDTKKLTSFILKKGDFLFNTRNTLELVGKSAVWNNQLDIATFNSNIMRIKFKEEVDDFYLGFYFSGKSGWSEFKRVATGTTSVAAIYSRDLLKCKVLLPDYKSQRKIAHILSTADAVIEKTQAAIAKYKAIKQGMLHDLFTRGLISEKIIWKLRPRYEDAPHLYKPSKLGWIPKEWEVERLDSLTKKIGSGITPTGGSEIYKSSGVLFIRSQNVLVGSLSIEDVAFITNEIDEKMESSRVKPFDVLLNITGASIGRCAYFPFELKSANVNQHVCIIRFKDISKSLSVFSSEFLNSNFGQNQINKSNAGGNRDGLNFQQIKSFHFPVLNFSELEQISMIFGAQNNKIQTEQNYLHKLQQIKSGLMADLLSGESPNLDSIGLKDSMIKESSNQGNQENHGSDKRI